MEITELMWSELMTILKSQGGQLDDLTAGFKRQGGQLDDLTAGFKRQGGQLDDIAGETGVLRSRYRRLNLQREMVQAGQAPFARGPIRIATGASIIGNETVDLPEY